jgi:hypothetical protein
MFMLKLLATCPKYLCVVCLILLGLNGLNLAVLNGYLADLMQRGMFKSLTAAMCTMLLPKLAIFPSSAKPVRVISSLPDWHDRE